MGYTPHLVTAVWGGNPDWRQKMTLNFDSYYIAARMCHQFMQTALDILGISNEWFPQPAGLVQKGSNYYLPGTQ